MGIPRRNKDIVCREIAGETILVPVYRDSRKFNAIYTLNPAAAWIWNKIDGKRGWDDIKTLLLKNFDVTSLEADRRLAALRRELEEIKAVI